MADTLYFSPGGSSTFSGILTDVARLPAANVFTAANTFTQFLQVQTGKLYASGTTYSFTEIPLTTADSSAFGSLAGSNNTGAAFTGSGYGAGYANTGANFTGSGSLAGYTNTGANFTGVGYVAGYGNTFDNVACFGDNTICTGANQVQVGKAGTTVYSYATATRSDSRDKTSVEPLPADKCTAFIKTVSLVRHKWDLRDSYRVEQATKDDNGNIVAYPKLAEITKDGSHEGKRFHTGFIAQNVRETLEAVGLANSCAAVKDASFDGGEDVLSLDKDQLYVISIAALQALIKRVEVLEAAK